MEVRFISGMSPAFVDTDGPHFVQVGDLSGDLVGELHQLCLSLADDEVAGSKLMNTYSFALRGLGRFLCKYERRGDAANLILVLDSDAAETIDAIRPTTRPSSGAEAKRKGKGH